MNGDNISSGQRLPAQYKTLDEAITLVRNAVKGEREDELFYNYLLSEAPTHEEKDIITSIRNDEIKHNKMFKSIYKYFTGQNVTADQNVKFERPESYLAGITKAFFGELAAMERYRIIRAGMPEKYFEDMVFEILTDELKHADKYNYIMIKHAEEMNPENSDETESETDNNSNNPVEAEEENKKGGATETAAENEMESPTEAVAENKMERPTESVTENKKGNQVEAAEEDKYDVSPDERLNHLGVLINHGLNDVKLGINARTILQEFILMGELVGEGMDPESAYRKVKGWERSGASEILNISRSNIRR